ncbi:MAG: hypothetical protein R3D31_04120 [Hyphomicrobiaceae bacterium]
MVYKGDDVSMRSRPAKSRAGFPYGSRARERGDAPAVNGAAPGGRRTASAPAGALPADAAVTACCDLAFESARAGGSREVMLVHLVHALTRVPESAQTLETTGVHVNDLRRDSAEIIFSDMPVGQAFGSPPAGASEDFETAMRVAERSGLRRGAGRIQVGDLLVGVINGDQDALAVQLLRRHWPDWQRAVRGDVEDDTAGLPVREGGPSVQLGSIGEIEARLEAIERRFSTLIDDMSASRKSLHEMLRTVQDELAVQRLDAGRLTSLLTEQVKGLEDTLVTRFADGARLPGGLTERLVSFERSIESKLGETASTWRGLSERLHDLEVALQRRAGETPTVLLGRLEQVEAAMEARIAEASRSWGGVPERLASIEKMVASRSGGEVGLTQELEQRLEQLETRLAERSEEMSTRSTHLMERLTGFERGLAQRNEEMQRLPALVAERIGPLERHLDGVLVESRKTWSAFGERLQGVERTVNAQSGSSGQLQTLVSERLQAIQKAADGQQHALVANVSGAVTERIQGLEKALDGRLAETARGWTALSEWIKAIETSLGTQREEGQRALRQSEAQVAALRESIAELASSQQALVQAVDQFRLDSAGDLGIISNRLETVEHMGVRPVEMLEQLNQRLQQAATEQAPRRRGFWSWLFGVPASEQA